MSRSASAPASANVAIRRIGTQPEATAAKPIAFQSYTLPISEVAVRLAIHPTILALSAAVGLLVLTVTGCVACCICSAILPPVVVWLTFRLLCWLRFQSKLPDWGDKFLQHWTGEDRAMWGAFRCDTGELVGTIAYSRIEDAVCEMHRLGVIDTYRGRGLGRVLCEHLFEQCRSLGYKRMQLRTATTLERAIGIYEKLGFKLIEESRVDFYVPEWASKFLFFEKEL